jgi:ribonuclease BN (tRNA processing enzyme)
VRITVLGKSPAWQDAGGTCSGYLVEHDGFVLLLDCGNGVFARLREHREYVDVDAVLITHLHGDHFFDLVPYSYALRYAPRQQPEPEAGWPGTSRPARPALHVPPGARAVLRRLLVTFASEDLIESAFALEEYDGVSELTLGPLTVRFQEVPHYTRTFAVDITAADGSRFTFGADCAPNDKLVTLARDTELLLLEATLSAPDRDGVRGHLTAREAGDHARRARARRCVLTHFSDELDEAKVISEGVAGFGAAVELASEGAVYELSAVLPPERTRAAAPAAAEGHGP